MSFTTSPSERLDSFSDLFDYDGDSDEAPTTSLDTSLMSEEELTQSYNNFLEESATCRMLDTANPESVPLMTSALDAFASIATEEAAGNRLMRSDVETGDLNTRDAGSPAQIVKSRKEPSPAHLAMTQALSSPSGESAELLVTSTI
jgi:hypothetical protein